jgi:hypothetical protein
MKQRDWKTKGSLRALVNHQPHIKYTALIICPRGNGYRVTVELRLSSRSELQKCVVDRFR